MKFEDLWHHISSYVFYSTSLAIAIFIDGFVSMIGLVLHLPSNIDDLKLKDFITKGSSTPMNSEEFVIRVVDGHMLLWGVSVTELLQITLITLTIIATLIKAYIDIHSIFTKKDKTSEIKKKFSRSKRVE